MKLGIQPEPSQGANGEPLGDVLAEIQVAEPPEPELDLALLQESPASVQEQTVLPGEPQTAATPQPLEITPAVPVAQPPAELLRLLRDPASGQLIVEVAGNRYKKLADITDKQVGQYVLNLAAHMLKFSNGVIAVKSGMKSVFNPNEDVGEVPHPLAGPEPAPAETKPLVPPPSPEAQAAFLAALRANPPGQPEAPTIRPTGVFGLGRPPVSKSPLPVPSLNLADEINEIVQAKLLESPLAESIRIDITSNLDGSIRIHINGQHYDSPDDIADPDVKKLIKDSIKAWERS
jgi:hypothetical protein